MNDCQELKDIIDKINNIIDLIERRNKIRSLLEEIFALIASVIPGFPIPALPLDDAGLDAFWIALGEAAQGVDC